MSTKKKPNTLDSSLKELESLVTKMESKELPLEKSLEHFEKGIALINTCQHILKKSELKIQQLIDDTDQSILADIEHSHDE